LYDLIGDIHGHVEPLKRLLEQLGYEDRHGCFRHPVRQAILVGDFIDRGPAQREVLKTVMPMVKQGAALAVMGNHEFNALAFHTADPANPGAWLRPRNAKNIKQHLEFLNEYLDVKSESDLNEVLDFFWSLPAFLDLGDIRVVHACWDDSQIETLKPWFQEGNLLSHELLVEGSREGRPVFDAIETLLKGAEMDLPDGISFTDQDGHERKSVRVRWWCNDDSRLGDITMPPGVVTGEHADIPVPSSEMVGYAPEAKPVFFGHYWFSGQPGPIAPNVTCLDYSVAKGGDLVAYRWQGEKVLDPNNYQSAPPGMVC
jgi:hypothetical protein